MEIVLAVLVVVILIAVVAYPGVAGRRSRPQKISPSTVSQPQAPTVVSSDQSGDVGRIPEPAGGKVNLAEYGLAESVGRMAKDSLVGPLEPSFARDVSGALVTWRGNNSELFPFESVTGREYVLRFSALADISAMRKRYLALEGLSPDRRRDLGLVETSVMPDAVAGPDGRHLDAIVMSRVPGVSLNEFVEANYTRPWKILTVVHRLEERFRVMNEGSLGGIPNFAHGDLQNANILVTRDDSVWFIDYDDVYLHGLSATSGIGHENFRHPGRSIEDWGPYMDTFSQALIVAALYSIAEIPDLHNLSSDTSLLFTRYDLENPGEGELWRALTSVRDPIAQSLLYRLMTWCHKPSPPHERFEVDTPGWN